MVTKLGSMMALLVGIVAGVHGQTTIRVPLSEQIAVITFDENRVSAEDVKRWIQLAENGGYSGPIIQFYSKCQQVKAKKLEHDIEKTRRLVSELDPTKYPVELSDVVVYLRRLQSSWLWQAEQQLVFLKTGQLPATDYDEVNLKSCSIHPASNWSEACHRVFFDWHNCVNDAMLGQLGPYPKQQWESFLAAYGIQVRFESTIENEE